MFRKKPNWAVDPITGDPQWKRHEAPRPDLMVTVEQAIEISGVDPREVNKVTCLAKATGVITGMGSHYLRQAGQVAAAEGLLQVVKRPDATTDMLWDYFSHHGAAGVAAQRRIVEHLTSGEAAAVLADVVRRGDCGFGFGGTNRI